MPDTLTFEEAQAPDTMSFEEASGVTPEAPFAFPKLSPFQLEQYKSGSINPITNERQTFMGAVGSSPLSLVPPVRAEEPLTAAVLAASQPFTGLPPDVMAAAINEAKGLGEFGTSALGKITLPAMAISPIIRRGLSLLFGGQLALGARKKIAEATSPQEVIEGLLEGAGAPLVAAGALPRRAKVTKPTATETTPVVPPSEMGKPPEPKVEATPEELQAELEKELGQEPGFKPTAVTPKDLALQAQREAGWNPKWPFVPADFSNKTFRDAIESDPTLSAEEKDQMFAAAEKLLGGKIERQKPESEVAPSPPGRDWEVFNEQLQEELDSFNPARTSGRINYELNDVADRFVDFAKKDKTGKPIDELVREFAEEDDANPSQIKKLSQSVKSILSREKPIAPAPPAETGEGKAKAIEQEAKLIADAITERKSKVTRHYQYDFQVEALNKLGLNPDEFIDNPAYQKLWSDPDTKANRLQNTAGFGLLDIGVDPKTIADAIRSGDISKLPSIEEAKAMAKPPTPPPAPAAEAAPPRTGPEVGAQVPQPEKPAVSQEAPKEEGPVAQAPEAEVAPSPERPPEPWQMTRDSAVWQGYAPDGLSTDRALKGRLARWEKILKEASSQNVSIPAVESAIAQEKARIARANAHRSSVEQAINEGKPVPPKVLADYPDLQPKTTLPPAPAAEAGKGQPVKGKPTEEQIGWLRKIDQTRRSWKQKPGGTIYPTLEDIGLTKKQFQQLKRKGWTEDRGFGPDITTSGKFESDPEYAKSLMSIGRPKEPTPSPPTPLLKEQGFPAGPGAQTVGTDVPPGAQIEQLSQAFRQITAEKTPLSQKIKEAFALGQKRELSQNLIARTLSALKTSGDYLIDTWRGQSDLDPILKAKGELSAELETRGWRLRQAMKDMKRAVPSRAVREAISKYVDAGGDMEKLRQSAESVPATRREPYLRAMRLTPDEKVVAGHIRSYFDARLQEAIDAGVLSHGVEDYLHRIYPKDTTWRRGVINAVQNSLLDTRNPGLAKQRVFQLDSEAERAGHLPVNDFIPRILDYEASLSKVIASRAAVKRFTEIKMPDGRPMLDASGAGVPIENPEGIREATLIKPSFKPGEKQLDENGRPTKNYRLDYQSRDYPALKKWKWATNDAEGNPIFVQGDVLVHPDAVHRIDALLEPSKVRKYAAARAALTVGSVFKQTMLDFSGFHQVQIAIHGLEHKVNPFNLVKDVDTNNPDVQGLLKGGMTLGGQHVSGIYQEGLVGRSLSRQIPGIGAVMQSYHDWLFQDFIPRVKTTMAMHALERNKARFAKDLQSGRMTPEALYHQTAKEANAAFGEQNYIMLERSKTAQDMARLILLAPDFLESRGRFALQAGTRLGGEQRMALLLGAFTLYATARLMNKALNDEWHFEPENMFSVIHNGKAYSVRTVQGDILHALESPVRFWMHRLNPTITRPLFELMTQRDEFGRKRSFWQVMGDTISNAIPISMRASREQSIWTSLLNAFGGSVRRDSDINRVYQEANKWKEKHNVRTEPGEFIYDPSKDIYRPLKLALLDGNPEGAAKEYQKLISSKVVTPQQVNRHFVTYANTPFSGSKKNEQKFFDSLTKDQKHAYLGAKQEKQRLLQSFIRARGLTTPETISFQEATQ